MFYRKEVFNGIRFKITLTFSATFTLIFLITSIIIYYKIKQILIESDNESLLSRAEVLLSKTEVSPVIIPVPNDGELIRINYSGNGFDKVLYSSSNFPNHLPAILGNPGVIDLSDRRIAIVKRVIQEDGDEQISLCLMRSNAFLNSQLRILLYILVLTNVLSIAIASFFSFLLSAYMLSPIKKIIRIAHHINAGQKIETIEVVKTGDELQDLTETLNDMFRRIETGVRQQHNFFASAAHELRTPLSILITSMEVTLKKGNLPEGTTQFIQSYLEEINRLSRIVEDFLLVSQLKNPELLLRIQKIAIDELILDIAEKFNKRLLASSHTLNIKFAENANNFYVECDKDKISHVFINIIENAIKYALPGSELLLTLSKDNLASEVIIGLHNYIEKPIANIDKLPHEFYQSDVLNDGYGMGLWISDKIISLHGGHLNIRQYDTFFEVFIYLKIHPDINKN